MMLRARTLRFTLVSIGTLVAIAMSSAQSAPITSFSDGTMRVGLSEIKNTVVGDNHGGGAVFTDLNNDGYPDIYLIYGDKTFQPDGDTETIDASNLVLLNISDGAGGRMFQAQTGTGAEDSGDATGATAADYDNDGDIDIYVTNYNGSNRLFQNQLVESGALTFVDVAGQLGVARSFHHGVPLDNSMTAVWADVNRDGALDLYVGGHNSDVFDRSYTDDPGFGQRDTLFLSSGASGGWAFTDRTLNPWEIKDPLLSVPVTGFMTKSGFDNGDYDARTSEINYGSSNAAIFTDFDGDGWMDLWVTNQIGRKDMVYRNLGADNPSNAWNGFELLTWAKVSGVDYIDEVIQGESQNSPILHLKGAAMGIDAGDFDNDGDLDIYASDLDSGQSANDLWINHSADNPGALPLFEIDSSGNLDGAFSWGVKWADFDNDGWLDVHVATQAWRTDFLYSNNGTGTASFTDVGADSGIAGGTISKSARGDVVADYDRDGDLDLLVINIDDLPTFYENTTMPSNNWIAVRLIGDPASPGPNGLVSTKSAVGGRVLVFADTNNSGSVTMQTRELHASAGNSASSSTQYLHFGVGQATDYHLRVEFPSGTTRTYRLTQSSNKYVDIDESLNPLDINCNGVVDAADLEVIIADFGCMWDTTKKASPTNVPCVGDLNGDGLVDVADVQVYIDNQP